jgi:hypothetical protein
VETYSTGSSLSDAVKKTGARSACLCEDDIQQDVTGGGFPETHDELCNCQGAWQEIPDPLRTALSLQLQSFVITGKVWFACDGADGYLERRENGTVLLEGGVLTVMQDGQMLCRSHKQETATRYERVTVPTPEAADVFRGKWTHTFGNVVPPDWLKRLTISGTVWKGGEPNHGGFLKVRDGRVLLLDSVLYLYEDGCTLVLTSPSGSFLKYEYQGDVRDPWFYT